MVKLATKNIKLLASSVVKGEQAYDNAAQISLELQRLGFRIMTGAVPLSRVLSVSAPVILEDWTYCRRHVEAINRRQSMYILDDDEEFSDIHFVRRHAEWLAIMAALYLHGRLAGSRIRTLLSRTGDIRNIRNRAQEIMASEKRLMAVESELDAEVQWIISG